MFYIITICGAAMLIALCNFFADGVLTLGAFGYMMLITFAGVVAVIAVDGILAFVARRMPEKWFSPEAKLFADLEAAAADQYVLGLPKILPCGYDLTCPVVKG